MEGPSSEQELSSGRVIKHEIERHGGRLMKKFWGRSHSNVWDFFRFEVNEEGQYVDKRFMYCLLCDLEMKYCGNTTNMSNHLDRKHPGCRHVLNSDSDVSEYRVIKQEEDESDILSNLVEAYAKDEMTCSVEVHHNSEVEKEIKTERKDDLDSESMRIFKSFWGDSSDNVWDYFKFEADDMGRYVDRKVAHCTICDTKVIYTGDTSGMVVHLDTYHPGMRTGQAQQEKDDPAPSSSQEEDMVKRLVAQCSKEIEKEKTEKKTPSATSSSPSSLSSISSKEGRFFKTFWGNGTSIVWKFFKFEADKDGSYIDKNVVYCMVCNAKLKYCHNTTNMAHHLERLHKIVTKSVSPIRPCSGVTQENYRSYIDLIEKLPTATDPRPDLRPVRSFSHVTKENFRKYIEKLPTITYTRPKVIKTTKEEPKELPPPVYATTFYQKRFQERGDILLHEPRQYRNFWGNACSPVWKHFKFEADDDGNYVDKMATYCTLCGLRMKYFTSTSNLAQHLRRKHFEEYFAVDSTETTQEEIEMKPKAPKPTQPKSDIKKEDKISEAIAEYLIADVHPFSDVETPSFKQMCEAMCPEYCIPGKTILKTEILMPLYIKKKEQVLKEISETVRHCVTIDRWKAESKENYISVTILYLDAAWNYHNRIILTSKLREMATPQEFATRLSRMTTEWNLISPVMLTDGSYVMKSAATNVLHWPNVPGLDYTVDMAVMKALSLPQCHEFLSMIRNLFSQLKQVAHCVQIKQIQDMMYLPEKDLFREFGDHWTQTLEMLMLFAEQEPIFKSVVIDCSLDQDLLVSSQSLARMRDLIQILQVLKIATAYLNPLRRHTLSVIMPMLIKLKGCLKMHLSENEFVTQVKRTMLNVIGESYDSENVQTMMKTASALDPRMKKLAFLKEEDRDEIRRKLCQEAVSLAEETVQVKKEKETVIMIDSGDDEPRAKVARTDDDVSISDWLGDIVCTKGPSPTIAEQVDMELKLFITEQDIIFDDSPLEWWQRRWEMYPLLSRPARKYMCIPAISSDTITSKTKSRRVYLESETVDMQLFLNLNN